MQRGFFVTIKQAGWERSTRTVNHTWYLKRPSSYQARKIFLHFDVRQNQQAILQGIRRIDEEVGHSAQQLGPFFEQAPTSLPGTVARIVIVVCSYFPSSPFQRSSSKQRGGGARRQDQSRIGMQECELVPKNLTKVFQLCGEASRAGDSNGGKLSGGLTASTRTRKISTSCQHPSLRCRRSPESRCWYVG
jgi:hypothetical protein